MAGNLLDSGLFSPLAITMLGSYLLWRGGVRQIDSVSAWAGLLYQVLISQFLGFAFYYRGLAFGGVAKMSQVQQFQPVLAVLAASTFLGEHIDVRLWIVLGILLMTVVSSRWTLQSRQTGITHVRRS
jgi:drug/metabolite transporter (DMT)-like permease